MKKPVSPPPAPSISEVMQKEIAKSSEQVIKLKKKLKVVQQKNRRLSSKMETMKNVINQLSKKALISSSCEEYLQQRFSNLPLEIFKRHIGKSGKGVSYSPELKSFALTLQFYSSKTYEFV